MNSFTRKKQEAPENWGYDLLRYGNEEIIRGSDTGTLVAFGAIAFQELKGEGLPHQHFGCGMLLFSVLLCAVVHFAVGGATIGRGRQIIHGDQETRGQHYFRVANQMVAWVSAAAQFIMTVIGVLLVLKAEPPPFLEKHLMSWF